MFTKAAKEPADLGALYRGSWREAWGEWWLDKPVSAVLALAGLLVGTVLVGILKGWDAVSGELLSAIAYVLGGGLSGVLIGVYLKRREVLATRYSDRIEELSKCQAREESVAINALDEFERRTRRDYPDFPVMGFRNCLRILASALEVGTARAVLEERFSALYGMEVHPREYEEGTREQNLQHVRNSFFQALHTSKLIAPVNIADRTYRTTLSALGRRVVRNLGVYASDTGDAPDA